MKRAKAGTIIALGSLAALAAGLFPSCYEAEVASAYLSIISKARPVKGLLEKAETAPELRYFLLRAQEARAFAVAELGLKDSKNYTTYADPGRDHIADVVQACAELSFQRYLWPYPLVGKLPYKGFFGREKADAEAARLRAAGWEALVRPVDAFSTLGALSDPLWPWMATYSEADLADLIIHELTHATSFARGQDSFNEELASFVGERGSILYLERRHGKGSPEVLSAIAQRDADRAFRSYLSGTAALLEAVYSSAAVEDLKRKEKARIILDRAEAWKALAPRGYQGFDMASVNNAYLDLYRLYYGEEELYGEVCDRVFGSDLKAFIQAAARLAKAKGDPKEGLKRLLDGAAGGASAP